MLLSQDSKHEHPWKYGRENVRFDVQWVDDTQVSPFTQVFPKVFPREKAC